MVWTEGIFVANDFWRGIKQNFKQMLFIALLYSLVFYVTQLSISLADYQLAVSDSNRWLFVVSKVLSYVVLLYYTFMTFHMITMSVTYELKFTALIKNSFLFTLGLLPQNIFFALLGIIPFIPLFIGNFFLDFGIAFRRIVLPFGVDEFLSMGI